MVGMVSLSLPTIPVVAEEGGVGDSHPLLYVRWHEHDFKVEEFGDAWWFQEQGMDREGSRHEKGD